MGEIKPGCLALVFGLKINTEDNGKMVTVERTVCNGSSLNDKYPRGLYVGDTGWLCVGDSLVSDHGVKGFAIFGSQNLLPINPSADQLEKTKEQEQTA